MSMPSWRDRHSACFLVIIIRSPAMSTPLLAVTATGLLLANSSPVLLCPCGTTTIGWL